MGIERELHDLLYKHDCVVVPGFGGFLTHYRPARVDEQRRLVHPPSKEVSFNRRLVRQDGLLADAVAKHEGLDFQVARSAVDEEVAGWRSRLDGQGRLEVGRIGTFFHDAEQNLQFEPDKRVNFLKEAYGLRPVPAIPVARPAIAAKKPQVAVIERTLVPAEEARKPRSLLAAAAVAAILLTGATWFTMANNSPKGAIWSGFDLFRPADAQRYELPPAPAAPAVHPVNFTAWTAPVGSYGIRKLPIAGKDGPLVAVDLGQAPLKAEPESTAVATRRVADRYHVIGGCFLEKENADRFIADLQAKGFAASLVDRKGGLYRVAYGSYPLRSTALEALNAVRKEMAPDAWLLVK